MAPEILDTDLFVVNRDDVTYKVSAEDLNLTGPKPINPGPDQIQIDPSVPGTGTELDPFILSPVTVSFGSSAVTVEEITISGEKGGDLVIFIDEEASFNGSRFQPIGTIVDGSDYKTRLRFSDVPESTVEQEFVGKLRLAETQIHFRWAVTVEAGTEVPVLNAVTLVGTGTDTSKRFEDQSFHTTLDIDEGKPVSTKSIAYKVAGTLSVTPTTSEIVGEDKVTVPGGWTAASASEANPWTSVTYGGGKFVAVANFGTNQVMYSTNGINWTSASATGAGEWYSVTYGDNKFVAVKADGTNRVMYSTNGINWTSASATEDNNWFSVTYGGGKFVAVAGDSNEGGGNRVMYSTDGITWTAGSGAEANGWQSVTYGDGKFVAVATTGTNRVMYSTDGINWTAASAPEANTWFDVTYGNGKFVAVARDGTNRVMYSTDGINWTAASATEANQWQSVTYGDGKFVAVSRNGTNRVMYSTNGINWTSASETEASAWRSVTYGDGKFVAVALDGTNQVMWSLYGNDPYEAQTLTLADNKDLDKFTVRELVKQNAPVVTENVAAFATKLYRGAGGTAAQVITTGIDLTNGGLVWTKARDSNRDHMLGGPELGVELALSTNLTAGVGTPNAGNYRSFDKDGYTTGGSSHLNNDSINYVSWSFRRAPRFLDIQTYQGNNSTLKVPHDLGSIPGMIIVKSTSEDSNWDVYHSELGNGSVLKLHDTDAAYTGVGNWDNTDPTSTEFTLGNSNTNKTGQDYIAYLFADTPGLIKCGDYTGTGSNQTIECGFKPQWLMFKGATLASDWKIADVARGFDMSPTKVLDANANLVEGDAAASYNLTSVANGFTVGGSLDVINKSNAKYIYVAIAENAVADLTVLPAGLFESYDDTTDPAAPTMTLTPQTDGWSANTGNYAVGEENVSNNATLYLETNNSRQVTGTSSAPVYYDTTATTDEITFDLPPGTGQSWDDELPDGTTIEACAHASNETAGGGRSPLSGDICSTKLQPEAGADYEKALGGLTTLYTGNTSTQTITNGIDLANEGGMVWIKNRGDGTSANSLFDTERGPNDLLASEQQSAAFAPTSLTEFNNNGFDLEYNASITPWVNTTGNQYVAWTFQKAPGYFDIQTWTGTDNQPRDISHNLSTVPGLIIVKETNQSGHWRVYSKTVGAAGFLRLNDAGAATTSGSTYWGNTEPTDSVFTVGEDTNLPGVEHVAYLFADDTPGTIKCGSYTGAGSSTTVNCGFKPQWILIKSTELSEDWVLFDTQRGFGPAAMALNPNTLAAEGNLGDAVRVTDTGFTTPSGVNEVGRSGTNYIYVAIAAPVVRNLTQEEVNATKLLFETKDYRQAKYEQDLVSRASSLRADFEARGFTTAEIDAVLNPDVTPEPETPVAISGYYPLYTTESASNAAGDGTSHTHEFDGVTYYMPNGVTFYHGDYGSDY
jgi:hypothetical protein